jgi:hypothetical protein
LIENGFFALEWIFRNKPSVAGLPPAPDEPPVGGNHAVAGILLLHATLL